MEEIVTDRLVLRPLQESDLPALVAYRRDPEVARFQTWEAQADWCKGECVTLRLFAVLAREWATRRP